MREANQDKGDEQRILLSLSDGEVLQYLVDRTTDIVNTGVKAREEKRAQRMNIIMGVVGFVGFGTLVAGGRFVVRESVEEQFQSFTDSVQAISREVRATAAVNSLTFQGAIADLVDDDDAVRDLVGRLAASPDVAGSNLVAGPLVELVRQLGPTEQWAVIDEVDGKLSDVMDDNGDWCSAMVRNYGVRVVGADNIRPTRRAVRDRLETYLECLGDNDEDGELLFWELLTDFQQGKRRRTEVTDTLIQKLDLLRPSEYSSFFELLARQGWADWQRSAAKNTRETIDSLRTVYEQALDLEPWRMLEEIGVLVEGDVSEGSLSGDSRLYENRPTDRWSFTPGAGRDMVIDARASEFDMFIYVRAPDGERGSNDDFGGGLDSRCRVADAEEGEYIVLVHDYFGGVEDSDSNLGAYTLRVRQFVASEDEGVAPCFADEAQGRVD